MKKVIISACAFTLLAIGCNSNKTDDKTVASIADTSQMSSMDTSKKKTKAMECKGRDMRKYKVYSKDDVALMADHYRDLVFKSYLDATQSINLNPVILQQMACDARTIKFISTAEDNTISMTIEYARVDDKTETYYDLEEIFGKGMLCPPPNNCGITTDTLRGSFSRDQIDSICNEYDMKNYRPISPDEAAKMLEAYIDAVKGDYRKVIQQITLDPQLLYAILCSVEGFKLIGAADDKGDVTMLILYQRDGKSTYYNIKDVFGATALCPPPDNCGIPYEGMIKKSSKRPRQK